MVASHVTISLARQLHPMLQDGMEQHPLIKFSNEADVSIAAIAEKAGVSRMTLYRLMKGEQNATIDLLSRVSAATDGKVPVSAFLPSPSKQGEVA